MAARNYRDNAPQTTITDSISTGDTSFGVASLAGWPSAPFTAVLEIDSASTEVVLVTGTTGNTITSCTRNYNAQGALSHVAGATFTHAAVAKDYDEANSHVNSVSGVHGVAGNVVGTASTQTLTNKTLTSPTLTSPTLNSPTINGNAVASGAFLAPGLLVQASAVKNTGGIALDTQLDGSVANWTEDFDTLGAFDPSTGKITIPSGQDGTYRLSGRVSLQTTNGSGYFGATIYKGSSIIYSARLWAVNNGSSGDFFTITLAPKLFSFSAGDVLRLGAYADVATFLTSASPPAAEILLERVN